MVTHSIALHFDPFHLQPPKQLHLLPLIALGHQHQELSRHRHRRSVPTRRILSAASAVRCHSACSSSSSVGVFLQLGVPGFSARAGIALNGQAVCRAEAGKGFSQCSAVLIAGGPFCGSGADTGILGSSRPQ